MMRVQVTAYNGEPLREPLMAEFDEMGGSIGRGDTCTLMLTDAKRYISRTQASIAFRAGAYVLRDAGSATPTYVNQMPVGSGNEVVLNDGDELRIAEYTLSVSMAPIAAARAPLDGAAVDPFARARPEAQRPPAAVNAAPSAQRRAADDPFAQAASPRGQGAAHNVIPSDFDPFGDLAPPPAHDKPLIPDAPELGAAPGSRVDDLFGLQQPDAWDPLGPHEDPVAGPQHEAPALLDEDPLDALMSGRRPPPRPTLPQRDDASPLAGAFVPPQARQEPRRVEPAGARPAPQQAPSNAGGMMFSWESSPSADASGDIKSVIIPSPPESREVPESRARERPAPAAPEPARYAPPAAARAPSAAPAAAACGDEELLKAFLKGAGAAQLRIPDGLTPELMKLIGALLREAISGTLELLLARALTKREVRAEAPVIAARENNPLKFSPTVEAALTHLLVSHTPGFMPPAAAIKDAYNDLRSHQFGIMAGMRAALTSVLGRFDPAQLEKTLTQKRALSSILPSGRKAKLWEAYEQLHSEILREAEDDFQALFGKEFLKAYEEQIRKLEEMDSAKKGEP